MIIDRVERPPDGLIELVWLITSTMTLFSLLCPIPSWSVQMFVIVLIIFGQIGRNIYLVRYVIAFVPPVSVCMSFYFSIMNLTHDDETDFYHSKCTQNRLGTGQSMFFVGTSLLALPLVLTMSFDVALTNKHIYPTVVFSIISAAFWIGYLIQLTKKPQWPEYPVLLPEDERRIASQFYVGTIEDASYVVGMTKRQLLRLSSSTKVLSQKLLLDDLCTKEASIRFLEIAEARYKQPPEDNSFKLNY